MVHRRKQIRVIFAPMISADQTRDSLLVRIQQCTDAQFEDLAMDVYCYQKEYNNLYKRFLELVGRKNLIPSTIMEIPHLPITLFKTHTIQTGVWEAEQVFTSSGTTGAQTSSHHIRSAADYLHTASRAFELQYGPIQNFCFLALLPSYLERSGSSLVSMADHFIKRSQYAQSGFFLHDHDVLVDVLKQNQRKTIPTVLLGVTYALLDLSTHPHLREAIHDPELITIMETGGMKGKRKEMTRAEVHDQLCSAFGMQVIHSEYGMTELMSQAYAPERGVFIPAPTMSVHTTELNDPFCVTPSAKTGILNITDLANLDSIAFISTEDLGRVHQNGHFEVIGRADISEMRGCNLMVE